MTSAPGVVSGPKREYKLIFFLSLAGLLSGLVTASAQYPMGPSFDLFLGVPFALVISACLGIGGVMPNAWRAVRFMVTASLAYPVAFLLAGGFQGVMVILGDLLERLEGWPTGGRVTESPIALFLGGVIGGFLILSDGVFMPRCETKRRALKLALLWSLLGGALGVIGWELGPTLGMAIWSRVHALGLTGPTETFQSALYETSHQYSLYVVWQTGMAFLLGVLAGRYKAKPPAKELEHP